VEESVGGGTIEECRFFEVGTWTPWITYGIVPGWMRNTFWVASTMGRRPRFSVFCHHFRALSHIHVSVSHFWSSFVCVYASHIH